MREETKTKLESMVDGLSDMNQKLEEFLRRNKEINEILEKVHGHQKELNELNGRITASNNHIRSLENMKKQVASNDESVEDEVNQLNQYREKLDLSRGEHKTLAELRNNQAIAATLLKDSGIKAKIIKHYLPIMNKLINHYLSSMDFFAQFHLDEEFNETIKSRHRDTFSYMSFSEGEKLRIDLSLLLAWREIARIKNSANCNLLILDEVFDSSLDGMGTDEFMKLLHSLGKKCNIFVISHKADHLADKFPAMLGFEKKGNFSRIIQ